MKRNVPRGTRYDFYSVLFANNLQLDPVPSAVGAGRWAAPIDRLAPARLASIAGGPLGSRAASYPQRAANVIHLSTATRHATRAAGLGVYLAQMQLRFLSTGHGTRPAGLVCLSRYKHRRHQTTGHASRPAVHASRATGKKKPATRAGRFGCHERGPTARWFYSGLTAQTSKAHTRAS